MYAKHDFICFTCDQYRPLNELKFTKDAGGRTRRICQNCEAQAKQELERLMQQDLTVN